MPVALLCATLGAPAFASIVPPQLCVNKALCRPITMPSAAGVVTTDGAEFGAVGGACSFVPPSMWLCTGTRGIPAIPSGIPGPYEPETAGPHGAALLKGTTCDRIT